MQDGIDDTLAKIKACFKDRPKLVCLTRADLDARILEARVDGMKRAAKMIRLWKYWPPDSSPDMLATIISNIADSYLEKEDEDGPEESVPDDGRSRRKAANRK